MVALPEILTTEDKVRSPFARTDPRAGDNDICTDGRVHHRNAENRAPVTRNRRSAPILGRWLTRDPIGYQGGINLYGYFGGEPVGMVDPAGLWKIKRDGQIALQLEIGTRSKALAEFVSFTHGVSGTINSNGMDGLAPGRCTYYGISFMYRAACETLAPCQWRIPLHGGGFASPGTISEWATNVAPGGSLEGYTASVGYTNIVSGITTVPGVWTTAPVVPNPAALP